MPKKPTAPGEGLTGPQKRSLAIKAKDSSALKVVADLASAQMTPAVYNRKVREPDMEIIMARISGGDTLTAVCEELGLSSNTVRQFVREHPEYKERWEIAKQDAAFAMVDIGYNVAFYSTDTIEARRLQMDYIKWVAERFNREAFSPRHQVDVRQAVAYMMPTDADTFC